ncbi:MAG: hypothetical protein LBT89_07420 [Planctomycetaceae bacterium]|jgi:hypothetical protein|nr:hypothetical protein [Planctomycetaceae bacterium]
MALFKKTLLKKSKKDAAAPPESQVPPAPKPPKPVIPPDAYTLILGLAVLFFVTAAVVFGLNYYWYQALSTPAVLPLDWAK